MQMRNLHLCLDKELPTMNQIIHSFYNLGHEPQCTQNAPCDIGQGICMRDGDCMGDLFCGKSNCVGELLNPWNNCCTNNTKLCE